MYTRTRIEDYMSNIKNENRIVLIAIWALQFITIPVSKEAANGSPLWFWISLEESFLHVIHLLF